jgi:hypothetical protein
MDPCWEIRATIRIMSAGLTELHPNDSIFVARQVLTVVT